MVLWLYWCSHEGSVVCTLQNPQLKLWIRGSPCESRSKIWAVVKTNTSMRRKVTTVLRGILLWKPKKASPPLPAIKYSFFLTLHDKQNLVIWEDFPHLFELPTWTVIVVASQSHFHFIDVPCERNISAEGWGAAYYPSRLLSIHSPYLIRLTCLS